MGYELRRQLREALGPDITGLQRAVALEIADDANDVTRESIALLEDLARWAGAKSTEVVRNALKRLAQDGWEFRVAIGKGKDGRILYAVPGTRMTFRVPQFEGGAGATPKGERELTQGGATARPEGATATPSDGQGGAPAHSEGAGAHSEGAGAPPYSSDPSDPSKRSNREAAARAGATPSPAERDHHLTKFGAFWFSYPKKKAREEAKKAWIAAIERGADPNHLVAAATAYGQERKNQDPKYTKYPATWLNKGCYDDEPDATPPAAPNNPQHNDWTMEDFHSGFAS
ncbi:hypothetical protein ABZ958_03240 [Streptomyces sp. NPDC046237]|uniref:hypothetical protein n=1 Tax=Streptomyces sp. NPDC046237 TaxID=3154914 RepID=UPI0033DC3242